MRARVVVVAVLSFLLVPSPTPAHAASEPSLSVSTVMDGLTHPWDVAFLANGTMFVTERGGGIHVRRPNGAINQLSADFTDLWSSGETGLMGIEADPLFATYRRIYTCQGTTDNGNTVQVVAWTIDAGFTTATRVNDPLVGGIDGSSGRHGGCQLRVHPGGALFVGTGDAATGTNPQNKFSLAGKTLRVDRFNGAGFPGNPFFGNPAAGDGRIYTWGHRNLQGLAVHPTTEVVWSAEHGTDRDDEINQLVAGGNYGWDPVPGYDESRPMTDFNKFPNAVGAWWSSGFPTIATSGATFLQGFHWGEWQGHLAVAALKDTSLHVYPPAGGTGGSHFKPEALDGTFGRLRGAELGPDGLLYVTTSNGGEDAVLVVIPHVGPDGLTGPGAVSWDANRIDVFARGASSDVLQTTFTTATGFRGMTSLGGSTSAAPDAASWGPGRLDVFILGPDGAIWSRAFTGSTWSAWYSLGGRFSSGPTAVSWAANRIDLFARAPDGAIWSRVFTPAGWAPWYSLGGRMSSDPDVASWAPGRLDLFATGNDNAIWSRAFTPTGWGPWYSLGGRMSSGPGAVSWGPNRIDVFTIAPGGAMWSRVFSPSGWSPWYSLGGLLVGDPDASSRGDGRIDAFAKAQNGTIWLRAYPSSPTSGRWNSWEPL